MGTGAGGNFGNTNGSKATKHGGERLKERGFSRSDISNTKRTANIKTQGDGAKVYIKEVSPGKYNVIVEGDRGIITALKNIMDKKDKVHNIEIEEIYEYDIDTEISLLDTYCQKCDLKPKWSP